MYNTFISYLSNYGVLYMTNDERMEKKLLRSRLAKLGITSSPNASLETLRKKYAECNSENNSSKIEENSVGNSANIANNSRNEALKLIRLRIKNLNPSKRELHGEIYTFVNNVIGKISKYVPYDDAGEAYHVPMVIYHMLKDKKFLQVQTYDDPRTHQKRIVQSWVPEFSLEVLPPLTSEELEDLAIKQKAQAAYEA